MLWSFLLISQRTTLHQTTISFKVKSMLLQLRYRSSTDCMFRLRRAVIVRDLRSRIMNGVICQINVAVDENGF